MYSEARKIHLIENLLKVKNEAILIKLENVFKKAESLKSSKLSAHDFLGSISRNDAVLMEKAINEGCEQIHADDWK